MDESRIAKNTNPPEDLTFHVKSPPEKPKEAPKEGEEVPVYSVPPSNMSLTGSSKGSVNVIKSGSKSSQESTEKKKPAEEENDNEKVDASIDEWSNVPGVNAPSDVQAGLIKPVSTKDKNKEIEKKEEKPLKKNEDEKKDKKQSSKKEESDEKAEEQGETGSAEDDVKKPDAEAQDIQSEQPAEASKPSEEDPLEQVISCLNYVRKSLEIVDADLEGAVSSIQEIRNQSNNSKTFDSETVNRLSEALAETLKKTLLND